MKFSLRHIGILLMIWVSLLTSGCANKNNDTHLSVSLDSIADTLFQGSESQVFFADGLGAYYFDDALNRPLRSEYGYSRGEWHLINDWQVISADGDAVNQDAEYTIIHPLGITRQYQDNLNEKIFVPRDSPGIVFSFEHDGKSNYIFRPVFDIRKLDREEAPAYESSWDDESKILTVYRSDKKGSCLTIACPEQTTFRQAEKTIRNQYQLSELTGNPSIVVGWSPGEFTTNRKNTATFSVGWADNPESSSVCALDILNNQEELKLHRQEYATGILSKLIIQCNDLDFIRSFSWARLNLFELGYKHSGGSYFLTGIPYSPFPNGFYSTLAIGGAMTGGLSPDESFDVLETLISHQQHSEYLSTAGMFPSDIREDSTEYQIPMIAGLVSDAYNNISTAYTLPHEKEDEIITNALSENLLGTCTFRLRAGLVYSENDQHFLYNGASSPYRNGATIESQVLFHKLRSYLKRFPQVHTLYPYVPQSLIEGVNYLKFGSKWVEFVAINTQEQYYMPLALKLMLNPFGDYTKMQWSDHLTFVQTEDLKTILAVKHDEKTIARILAMIWYAPDNARNMEKICRMAYQDEMIGASGFRSLSPKEVKYQSAHTYYCADDARGSFAYGDVLIWTAGLLGDMMVSTKQYNQLLSLMKNLQIRTLEQGVYGALAEAENSVPIAIKRDAVGNLMHLTSTSEYVRLVSDYIVGLDHRQGQYLTIKPHFPANWGKTTLTFNRDNGKVTIVKHDDLNYTVTQTNIEPSLSICLDISPSDGGQGISSFRLYPSETATVKFEYTTKGYISSNVIREQE